jgi:hypothetical protein
MHGTENLKFIRRELKKNEKRGFGKVRNEK